MLSISCVPNFSSKFLFSLTQNINAWLFPDLEECFPPWPFLNLWQPNKSFAANMLQSFGQNNIRNYLQWTMNWHKTQTSSNCVLILLRSHFIIIVILFQTTFLQERERRIGYKECLSHGKLVCMMWQGDSSVIFQWKKTDQVPVHTTLW